MADVFDYLTWRGDLPLERDGFNEVDGMILSRFSYIPFEHLARPLPSQFQPLQDVADAALNDAGLRARELWKMKDEALLSAMVHSDRFVNMEIGYGGSLLDGALQTQFSALTVRLGDGRYAIAFRGTDNTVVGWKEDLNMSFLCPVPAQEMAVEYVRRVSEKFDGRLILCGHSKGGNLAIYAGAFCGEDIQRRIDTVYNYDGPGFFDNILETEGFGRIFPKIHTFVPQFSVVGMLLGHPEDHAVVHSTESGLMQHDVYSWQVLGNRFRRLETVTDGSRFVDGTIKDWTQDMTPAQFEMFVDTIYRVLTDTKMKTMHEMRENWFDTTKSVLRSVMDMDDKTRAAALEALRLLARSAGKEAVGALQGV